MHLHDKLYSNNYRVTKLVAGQPQVSTLVDISVYTNNRNFRILLSSKFKDRGNRPLHLYIPPVIIPQQDLTYDIFRRTLIACNGIKDWNLLAWPNKQVPRKRRRLNLHNASQPLRRQESDIVRRNVVAVPIPNLMAVRNQTSAVDQYPKLWSYFDTHILPTWHLPLDQNLSPIACAPSVRSLKYSRYNNNFVYINVTGNRYCHNIQRQHTSNQIFFRVELTKFIFRQGCYDIGCNGVLSRALPLPPEILF